MDVPGAVVNQSAGADANRPADADPSEVIPPNLDAGTPGPGQAACGEQNFMLERGLPPDLLVVLDRSGSMTTQSGSSTRWDQVVGAVNQTVTAMDTQIRWGLELFPSDLSCGVSRVNVGIGVNNGMMVSTAIAANAPDANGAGFTPTTEALSEASRYLLSLPDQNPKFVLLATDGEPNCGPGPCSCPSGTVNIGRFCCAGTLCTSCPDEARAVAAVDNLAASGIHTFVIGIATRDTIAELVLDEMARSGKRARPGDVKYYAVDNQAELEAAIMGIASRIVECEFPLNRLPPSPDLIEVSADGTTVPLDTSHMSGWDFGVKDKSIAFFGDWCQRLQQGTLRNLRVLYHCRVGSGPVPPRQVQ